MIIEPEDVTEDGWETLLKLCAWRYDTDVDDDELGDKGGVGSAKENGLNSGSGSCMTGTSALNLGVVLDGGNRGEVRSSSLGKNGVVGDCTTGICWNGRNSEEPVLLHLSRGRLTSNPEVLGLSVIGDLRSPLNVAAECRWSGDNGGGGLPGGRLTGLKGI